MSNIYCYPVTTGAGTSFGALTGGVPVANSPQPKSGVHGLKFSGISFADPNSTSGMNAINNDLWAFWAGGTRGRTALYYSSAASSSLSAYTNGGKSPFTGAAVLPVPASLTAVSSPSAVLAYAPDPTTGATGTAVPVIEVTYGGVNPTGSANVYLSRYRPYHPTVNGTTNTNLTLLAPLPFRQITEQLQPDPRSNWWQARDVGWLRNAALNVGIGNTALLTGKTPAYDRASGLLVYTGITLNGVAGQVVFVDPGAGRVRFSRPLPAGTIVTANFNPTARRITTDQGTDAAPTAFLDETYQPNSSGVAPNVQADRYWFLWQKPALTDEKIGPSLWYKTQRLTVALTDTSGNPLAIQVSNGKPNVTVNLHLGGATLYDPTAGGVVDVDATRGRLYFPITNGGIALEGQTVDIKGTGIQANGSAVSLPQTAVVHWLDEPRYNDPSNQVASSDTTPGAYAQAGVPDGYQVPINTIKNEGGVTAFLDPLAYQNTTSSIAAPHNVWLLWNSTRNGTSDIFYETINPRFNPAIPASGAP